MQHQLHRSLLYYIMCALLQNLPSKPKANQYFAWPELINPCYCVYCIVTAGNLLFFIEDIGPI